MTRRLREHAQPFRVALLAENMSGNVAAGGSDQAQAWYVW
jgi:hypothetical protein